jgi:hypothetical protein
MRCGRAKIEADMSYFKQCPAFSAVLTILRVKANHFWVPQTEICSNKLMSLLDLATSHATTSVRMGHKKITKVVVGIHVLLTRSLFVCDILRRLLLRVSLEKPTFAPLRF